MFKAPSLPRGNDHTLTESMFNLLMATVMFYGFAMNWWMVNHIPAETIKSINPIVFIIGYLISAVVGSMIMVGASSAIVRFIGFNLVAVPIGLVLVMFIPGHSQEHIITAIQTTTILTVAMMVLGTLFPAFFRGIERALFWSLLICVVVQLIQSVFFHVHLGIMDWIVAAIFCGYIGLDWGINSTVERSAANAVAAAGSMYLNIINLFVRILSIVSNDD